MPKSLESKTSDQSNAVGVRIELAAAIVALADEAPQILLLRPADAKGTDGQRLGLPCGPFDPAGHRTLEEGLRTWVREQTALHLGYVEQLYTFGDRFRDPTERVGGPRPVSVGYLALVRQTLVKNAGRNPGEAAWGDWYRYFPWEDWREGAPPMLDALVAPGLEAWTSAAADKGERQRRRERVNLAFGFNGAWDNERVLDRYELLYEAGLVFEAAFDRALDAGAPIKSGAALIKDHRRILATAMGRLRAKIKYRPVVFEVMPPTFTLLQLQRAVEALSGGRLHKQNFRRLVAHEGLVEPTGQVSSTTGGRPAELFRFRREVVHERPAPGVRVPVRVRR